MTELEVLESAKHTLSERSRWTRGMNAREKDGFAEAPLSSNAVCFCLNGAIIRACDGVSVQYYKAMEYLRKAIGSEDMDCVVLFNDASQRTHEEVLAVLDKAILLARARANEGSTHESSKAV